MSELNIIKVTRRLNCTLLNTSKWPEKYRFNVLVLPFINGLYLQTSSETFFAAAYVTKCIKYLFGQIS